MGKVLQRILYVEDELDIQRIVQMALESLGGFSVAVCSSGFEALARAQALAPDLFLLDVMMPQLDGVQTLERLRKVPGLATTPVIFMTAKVQPDEVAKFKALGALAVIAKPFDPLGLVQTVRNAWQQAAPATVLQGTFAERLAVLTKRFHAELPQRLDELTHQWSELLRHWEPTLLEEFHRGVHSLAGSGATFGLDELSVRARAVDVQLKMLQQVSAREPAAAITPLVEAFFDTLRQGIKQQKDSTIELKNSLSLD